MQFKVDGEVFDFDENRLTFAEARALEHRTGVPFSKVGESAQDGGIDALQALIWIAMKRQQPTLMFSDLDDLAISDIEFVTEEGEADPTVPDLHDGPL